MIDFIKDKLFQQIQSSNQDAKDNNKSIVQSIFYNESIQFNRTVLRYSMSLPYKGVLACVCYVIYVQASTGMYVGTLRGQKNRHY